MEQPRIVVVGAGFGGLAATKALRKTPAQVTLIDRANHHLFQPLLYQVATSVLTPGQIGTPIRGILRNQKNTTVILGEVTGVDKDRKCVFVSDADRENVPIAYDYLILATGATHSYFGHNEFEKFAPGMKSLARCRGNPKQDSAGVRTGRGRRRPEPPPRPPDIRSGRRRPHRSGDGRSSCRAGPHHSEVRTSAGLIRPPRELCSWTWRRGSCRRFRRTFPKPRKSVLRSWASRSGLGHSVEQIDADGVVVAGERIHSKTVIWTAGVAPSPAGKWLNAETDRAGRVRIQSDLTVPGHPEIFVIGDTASLEENGKPLPGVAQVAMQQGRYAGKLIHSRIAGDPAPGPFSYFDKGSMAVVGKGFAVLQSGKVHVSGFGAWLAWAAVHLQFLATSSLRVSVFLQWVWTYVTAQRGSRLIVSHHGSDPASQSPIAL